MSKSRHTDAQIIAALKQVEAGRTTEDVAREQGVSKHTIYAWKAKYGGMEVSEAEEVKHLRDENVRLKKLVADIESRQGHAAVGDPKKLPRLVERRSEVRRLLEEFKACERHACELLAVPATSCRYRSRRDDRRIQERLRELAREHLDSLCSSFSATLLESKEEKGLHWIAPVAVCLASISLLAGIALAWIDLR